MFNFSLKTGYIDAKWLETNEGHYRKEDGEKMLIVYLNLYKFVKYNYKNFKTDICFITSVRSLYRVINYHKRILKLEEVHSLLKKLETLKIIQFEEPKAFKRSEFNNDVLDRLLIIKDVNYSNWKHYIKIPFDIIDYMLENELTYRHVILYLTMLKWTKNAQEVCYIGVNKLADWVGFSNKTVLKYFADLNRLGVLATYKKRNSEGHYYYNHYLLDDLDDMDQFIDIHLKTMNKYCSKDQGEVKTG